MNILILLTMIRAAFPTRTSVADVSRSEPTSDVSSVSGSVMEATSRDRVEGVLVAEGEQVVLSCITEKPWFFCLWYRDGSTTKHCAINYQEQASQQMNFILYTIVIV